MNPTIGELTRAAAQEAKKRPEVLRLMTHPGVGPLTALAFVLIIGTAQRFPVRQGRSVAMSGLIPCGGLPALASSVWDTSPNKAALCCGSCWWKRRKPQRVARCGLETTLCASDDAPAKEHRQGGHGPETGSAVVLDVAKRLGVCAVGQVQFARGTARYRTWRELERCALEWASRSLARGSLNG